MSRPSRDPWCYDPTELLRSYERRHPPAVCFGDVHRQRLPVGGENMAKDVNCPTLPGRLQPGGYSQRAESTRKAGARTKLQIQQWVAENYTTLPDVVSLNILVQGPQFPAEILQTASVGRVLPFLAAALSSRGAVRIACGMAPLWVLRDRRRYEAMDAVTLANAVEPWMPEVTARYWRDRERSAADARAKAAAKRAAHGLSAQMCQPDTL
jgi:hypothetical protein